MKRVSSILFLFMAIAAMANVRSAQEAAMIAQQFMSANVQTVSPRDGDSSVRLVHTVLQSTDVPAAYVFSRGENAGIILVSAEDNARAILGYTDSGEWDSDRIPTNMQFWLQRYAEEISSLQGVRIVSDTHFGKPMAVNGEKNGYSKKNVNLRVNPVSQRHLTTTAINPLLGDIAWDQGEPYNNRCPIDPADRSERCYTGCVATAAAQIMRAWRHPTSGVGSHSYYWEYGGKTLSASFNHSYDWSNMLVDYNSGYKSAQAEAVATLMSDLGIASDMSYGGYSVGGSGTSNEEMAKAMCSYFGYDKYMRCLRPDYMGQVAFESAVADELQHRPLLFGGATSHNEGHSFVCDGMDNQGFFHINWGWGGMQNGYFALSALDPDKQGAGGATSGEGFHNRVLAIRYIFPDEGYDSIPQVGSTQITVNKSKLKLGDKLNVSIHKFTNIGIFDWTGSVCMAIYDAQGTYKGQIDEDWIESLLPMSYYYNEDIVFTGKLPDLSEGEYSILPIYSVGSQWYLIETPSDLSFVVRGDSAFFVETELKQETIDLSPYINYVGAAYDSEKNYWTLMLGDVDTYNPWLQFSFIQKPTAIAGKYNVESAALKNGRAVGYLWLSDNDAPDAYLVSGQLNISRLPDSENDYPVYDVAMDVKGDNNVQYTLHIQQDVIMYDAQTFVRITPTDDIISSLSSVYTNESASVTKKMIDGRLVIQYGDQFYNVLGQPVNF